MLQAQAAYAQGPITEQPIRIQRPWLIELGVGYPKLPNGLGVSYNFNEQMSLGIHAGFTGILNEFTLTGRTYFSPTAGSVFAEVDLYLQHSSFMALIIAPGASAMLGYEYRAAQGLTLSAAAGLCYSPLQAVILSLVGFLPAASFTVGYAF